MKKFLVLITAFALAAILPSCKLEKLLFKPFESPLNFSMNLAPAGTGTSTTLGSTNVSYDLDAKIKAETNNEFGADFIKQIYINQIAITLTNSNQANNLSNFESITLQVSTSGGTPINLGPFDIPTTATNTHTITVPNSPNIRSYFNGQNVTFAVIGKTRTATTITLNANIGVTLKFDK
jgi:hypothetical protein